MDLSVVIPNFNGASRIEKCLRACLESCRLSGRSFEVILVDDASTDDSLEVVAKAFPEIRRLESLANRGFSKTCNWGAGVSGGDWILFLNNDCYLSPAFVGECFKSLAKMREPPFALTGAIHDLDGKLIDAAKYPEVPSASLWRGIRGTRNIESGDRELPTLFASGADAFVNRKKFLELGGFDETFSPYYLEDLDLGVSAWRHGWRSYYLPSAKCAHEVSATIGRKHSPQVRAVSKRNRWLFHLKHLPLLSLFPWVVVHLAELLLGFVLSPRVYFRIGGQLCTRLHSAWRRRQHFPLGTAEVVAALRGELDSCSEKRFF